MKPFKSTIAIGLGLCLAHAAWATVNKKLSFSKPINAANSTVTVEIDPGPDVPVVIPPGTTAEGKRDLIAAALIAAGYDVVSSGAGGNELTIRHLANGTKVRFRPGNTGERRDDVVSNAAISASVDFQGPFVPFDQEFNLPAVFTAGIVTDVGELTTHVTAAELNFQTEGPIICQALFQRLAPQAPQFGAQINFAGDRLEVYFDPAYAVTQGGVVFGTSSPSPGCSGELQSGAGPADCPEDVNGDGVVGLSDLSQVLGSFGLSLGMPGYNPAADINGDGMIDLADLSRVLAMFGSPCP